MKYKNLTIKNWAVEDRPREKLIKNGIGSLSDAEILAILIGSGTRNITALELSKEILHNVNNNLRALGKLEMQDLIRIRGIGQAKAVTILAALELGRRRAFAPGTEKTKITSSKDAFRIFQPMLGDLPHEEFWVLLLNRSNRVIDKICISKGGITGTVIDTRLILKQALDRLTSGIILCHNHPSGNLEPSDADKLITEKIRKAAGFMDITLIDHIIIGENNYYSFTDTGLI
jgi:DNA repair protein RadC